MGNRTNHHPVYDNITASRPWMRLVTHYQRAVPGCDNAKEWRIEMWKAPGHPWIATVFLNGEDCIGDNNALNIRPLLCYVTTPAIAARLDRKVRRALGLL